MSLNSRSVYLIGVPSELFLLTPNILMHAMGSTLNIEDLQALFTSAREKWSLTSSFESTSASKTSGSSRISAPSSTPGSPSDKWRDSCCVSSLMVRALATQTALQSPNSAWSPANSVLSFTNSVLRSAQPRQPGVAASTSADRLILLLPLFSMATSTGDTARGGSEKCGGCPRSWLFPMAREA